MSGRAAFGELVRRPVVPLDEGCCAIAAHLGHPDPIASGVAALDALAGDTRDAIDSRSVPIDLGSIAHHLFAVLGFRGDAERYYDVRNSMLPDVLRRRIGIPITLSIVVIEVAGRLGVVATGVGMPGHFLVGDGPDPKRWLDGFAGPRWIDAEEAAVRFHAIHGSAATFDPAFLAPTPRPLILARVLTNLAGVARSVGDPAMLLRALELRGDIPGSGADPRAQVELAEAYVAVGRIGDAVDVLAALTERVDPRRRDVLVARLDQLRASLN